MNSKRYFQQFMDLSRPGIFVIIDNRHKRVAVSHCTDLLRAISTTISNIRCGTHACQKLNEHKDWLTLEILETIEDQQTRFLRYEHWVAYYKALGYKMFYYKKALEFQVKLDVAPDFSGHNNLLAYINLVSRRGKRVCVGVFNTIDEAKVWVEAVYRPMGQIVPVYAHNELTKEYFEYMKVNK